MPDLIFNKLANWRANVFQTNIIINQWDFSNTMYCKSLISLFIIFFIWKFFISSRNFLNTTWISVSYEKNREVIIRSLRIYVDVCLHSLTYKSLPFYVLLTKYFLYFWTFSLQLLRQTGSYFWSAFSCIRTEYGDLPRKSPYSIRIQENTNQK